MCLVLYQTLCKDKNKFLRKYLGLIEKTDTSNSVNMCLCRSTWSYKEGIILEKGGMAN